MNVIVYGSKVFGQIVRQLVLDAGHQFIGFIDDFNQGPDVLGTWEDVVGRYPPGEFDVVMGIGTNDLPARAAACGRVQQAGFGIPRLVRQSAIVDPRSELSEGDIVMAGVVVGMFARVAANSVLWTGSVICHDSRVGSNTFVGPNATVCGFATVGRNCFLGAGSVVVNHCHVPDGTFVRAGAVYK